MLSAAIIFAIALAIFLGYKTKINTGLFCIVFAYIIGCFVMGLKPKQVIAYWPTNTMFVILSVSLFYNFAAINGTLEKMSGSLLYMCRKFPGLLPYALLAVAVILSVMGATYFTVLAFLAPITLVICDESRMDKLTGAVAINCGALAGGNFPTSNLGVIFRGLADTAFEASPDVAAVNTFGMEMKIFIFSVVFSLILVTIFRFGFKENRNIGKGVTFKKPEAFTKDQKLTLSLMMIMMVVVLIFPLLQVLMPGNAAIKYVSSKVDVGLVAIIFAVIAEEKSISKAAERLYMAQSSLSQFLQTLESSMASPLFVRTSRGVRPTEAGNIMVKYAYATLAEYHRTQDEIQDLQELKSGSVILGISGFRGSYLLPPVLNAFKLDYPGIRVQIVEKNSMALEQMLLSGEIDIALLVLPVSDSRIQPTFVMRDEICLISHENHPITKAARKFSSDSQTTSRIPCYVNLTDAIQYEFFLSDYDTILGREARRIFNKNGLQPITCNESLTALMAAALAAAGHGLAFTYYSSRHYFRDAHFLSLGSDGASAELAAALAPGRYHSKAALALQEVLLKVLSED